MEDRGSRNNNPGNIDYGSFAKSVGAVGNEGRTATFATLDDGIRAAASLLSNYQDKYGLYTIADMVGRWAPPTENNTKAYIDYMSKMMGIPPDQPISFKDKATLAAYLSAMFGYETGKSKYGLDVVSNALGAAQPTSAAMTEAMLGSVGQQGFQTPTSYQGNNQFDWDYISGIMSGLDPTQAAANAMDKVGFEWGNPDWIGTTTGTRLRPRNKVHAHRRARTVRCEIAEVPKQPGPSDCGGWGVWT